MALVAIKYTRGSLALLDQRLLPFENTYLDVPTPQVAWAHIKDMVVRGAPAIGVTGALSMAADLWANKDKGGAFGSAAEAAAYVDTTMDYLVTSRPTAVNLADSADKLKAVARAACAAADATPQSVVLSVVAAAEGCLTDDLAANRAMGDFGAKALIDAVAAAGRPGAASGKLRVLTHCNTGSLATSGFGTALGVIRALHEQGKLEHAYCTETRPYNQGARLTAYELHHDGLPSTLICDSAAAALMGLGQVDAVVVGADRVASNGDSANKIGTYSLSIAAKHHGVPFFIAAPTTTLDAQMPDGASIVIEQRPADEITHFRGARCVKEGIQVWNPSFDVAPAPFIMGIITEKGLIPKDMASARFSVRDFMASHGLLSAEVLAATAGAAAVAAGPAFLALDTHKVVDYVASIPTLQQLVGPTSSIASWRVREVGDGNINFVYVLEGPDGALCIKQSLPFVRCVGESWPLTQDRTRIEVQCLIEEAAHCPAHVPKVHHFDAANAVIVMEYLRPPFLILRRGMIAGTTYASIDEHISEFLASTLFHTSALCLDTATYRENVKKFTNAEMCALTEQVVFTEPFTVASNNDYNPLIGAEVAALQADPQSKVASALLKERFVTCAEALLHGDLHTGSVMVTESETKIIDPEFGYYGPMAFDIAKFLGEMLLPLFASYGQEAIDSSKPRAAQREWMAECVRGTWTKFVAKFTALWDAKGLSGALYPDYFIGVSAPGGQEGLPACQKAFFDRLFQSTLGFMGAIMIRRIVGISGVADIREIPDEKVRVGVERRALAFGRALLVQVLSQSMTCIDEVVGAAVAAAAAQ
ncbi:hypothetical protein FOA52_000927 [Chlamydomonas sp. UWO 241]|nr:hypothetical protein FOA52_000927 [Chlamydomonas sp. UWO 241]